MRGAFRKRSDGSYRYLVEKNTFFGIGTPRDSRGDSRKKFTVSIVVSYFDVFLSWSA